MHMNSSFVFFLFLDNGPCLGSRKPNQPYEWISYKEVRFLAFVDSHMGCSASSWCHWMFGLESC